MPLAVPPYLQVAELFSSASVTQLYTEIALEHYIARHNGIRTGPFERQKFEVPEFTSLESRFPHTFVSLLTPESDQLFKSLRTAPARYGLGLTSLM